MSGADRLEGRRTPAELDPDRFREIGHRLVDDVAELFEGMRERPLTPHESPEEIRALLGGDAPLPEHGTDPAELFGEVTRLVIDHSLYNAHPRFFGYVTAGAAPLGVLADFLASAVNPNVGSATLSPIASAIEAQCVRWIGELVGFEAGGGVLTSGGNVANMLGFWAARAGKAGWDVRIVGMRGEAARSLRVYGSAGTHTWIQKAADLSGLGADSIRWIEADRDGRIDLGALRAAIEADVAAGDVPMMVVGSCGTVSTGAVDPLPALRELCDDFGAWLHVDGAYGGFAAAVPDIGADAKGLALADSVALDPHKWLYAPLEAGCTLVRDRASLLAAFSYRPDYYHFDDDGALEHYFEHGIQNSRGFRALKVWVLLRQMGREGYARSIAEDIELARRFYDMAASDEELEAFTHHLSITTYRFVPADLAERTGEPAVSEYLDELNEAVQSRMEKSGRAFVSNAVLDGVYALRMCIVNFRTALEDMRALADLTVELGRETDAERRPDALR